MKGEKEEKEDVWSEWLDFNQSNITTSAIPEKPGVFKVHASMKILYIGSSMNLRQSLLESLSDPCIGKARRFSYLVTEKAEQVKDQLLKEYRESHGGSLPACMDK
jgi:excinuclease UvrABC nuclease subunit